MLVVMMMIMMMMIMIMMMMMMTIGHDVSVGVDGLAAMDVAVNFVRRWNFVRNGMDLPILPHPAAQDVPLLCGKGTPSRCQIVRSIGNWAGGVYRTETSILNAMLEVISSAEKWIYIENQYFISIPEQKNDQQRSKTIGDAIVHRIQRAFSCDESFHVVILLPAYPEGDVISDTIIHRVMFWCVIFYHYHLFIFIIYYFDDDVNYDTEITLYL
jgi:phospholipase D1/2